MAAQLLQPLLSALGVLVALQVPYLLLRRGFPSLLDRIRYQLWALSIAALAFLAFGARLEIAPFAFAVAAFATTVLSVDLGWRLLDRFVLVRQRDDRGRPAIPQLIRDVGGWLLLVAVVLVAGREFFTWDLSRLVVGSAVLSAIVGFALQDVLKNVFSGMALQTEQPFDTGDWLEVEGEPRQVLGMNWRATHMRNSLGVDFREPNANLTNARIKNHGSGLEPTGLFVRVGAHYGHPPRLVKMSLERAAKSAPGVVDNPPPAALMVGFADNGIQYEVRFWTRDVHQITRVRDGVLSRIWYQMHRDGWKIPYPTRTVEHDSASHIARDKSAWRAHRAKELLATVELFSALPEEALDQLAAAAKLLYYDAGERLVTEGETGDSLFVIARGSVMISKAGTAIGTTAVALATLNEGDYFGEMSLLTGSPRSASVVAEGPVEVFVLDRDAVAPVLAQDHAIAEVLSKRLADRLAATQARFEDREEELKRRREHAPDSLLVRIRTFFKLGGGR